VDLWYYFHESIDDAALFAAQEALMAPDERERHRSFHFDRDRHLFLATRVLARPYSEGGDRPRVLHGIPGHVRGPGHHSIVFGPDGKAQYMVYHAWDPQMKERQMCLDKLQWTPDGPHCDPTDTPQPVP